MNGRIGGSWEKILLETIYETGRSGKCLRLRGKDINHIRRGNRGDYWRHRRWGDGRIRNKGQLTTPIFNDRRTLICEVIK
jgi:hypothetical protein